MQYNLGNVSSALRLTGGDDLAERLERERQEDEAFARRNEELRALDSPRINDAPILERAIPDNPYAEPARNPYGESPVVEMPEERIVARPQNERIPENPYGPAPFDPFSSPKVREAIARAGGQPVPQQEPLPIGVPSNPYSEPVSPNAVQPQPQQSQQPRHQTQLAPQGQAQPVAYAAPQQRTVIAAPPPQAQAQGLLPPGTDQARAYLASVNAPMQEPQVLQQPATQRALQTLGYRVPQGAQGPQDVPQVDPNASVRQLQRQQLDTYNNRIGLVGQAGEVQSAAAAEQARVSGGAAQAQGQRNAAIGQRNEAALTRADANRGDAYSQLEELRQLVKNKPGDPNPGLTKAGEILSMIPGLNLLGSPMRAIAQSRERKANAAWEDEIAGKSALIKADQGMNASEHADANNEIDQQKGLSLLADAQKINQLEEIKATAQSSEQRLAAEIGMQRLTEEAAGKLAALKQGQAGAAAKQRAAVQQNQQDTAIMRALASVPEEQRPVLAASMGPRGPELLKKIQGTVETQAKIEGERASAEKDLRVDESKGGVGSEVLPGFVDTIGLDPAMRTEIRKNAKATGEIIEDLGKLRAIRKRNNGGTWDSNDESEARTIMEAMPAKLSQRVGAGAPSEGENERFMKALTDPTGFYMRKDPVELYDRMAQSQRSNFEAGLKAIGVTPRDTKTSGLGFEPDEKPEPKTGRVASRGAQGGW